VHLGIDASNIRQGGGVTHLSQLLQAGDPTAQGIERVTIWVGAGTAAKLPNTSWLHKRSAPWMEAPLPQRLLGQQLSLPGELRAQGCDLLFSPGGTLPAWSPVPTVTMSQNMLPFEPLEAARFGRFSAMRLKMRLLRQSQSRSFRAADGLIFLTEYAQQAITQALGPLPADTALIPHGIEPRFLQAPRPARPLSACTAQDPFRFLYVSILMPYKHQIQVACAVSRLRAQGWPVEIRFIGASWGHYGPRFRAVLEELDPGRSFLHWSGAEPFEALHASYRASDAFVFASSCENLPNILIEAMAAGLPIASADRGPMPEALGNAGVYFDPESLESITNALQQLAQDKGLRQHLAHLGWQRAQRYSWVRCAQETFAFLAQVAQRQPRTRRVPAPLGREERKD
jgi:glycosyltransferase involved in cell wall biosynthesis